MIIHVFLKNKLITLDSIIPFCMQLHMKCGIKFNFIIFDLESYRAIVEDNIVLNNVINKIGGIKCLGRSSKRFYKIRLILSLMKICVSAIFNNNYLIHFGLLDTYPFNKIFRFVSRRKIILSESSEKGRYANELKSALKRSADVDYFQFRVYDKVIKKNQIERKFRAGTLLGFDKDWNYFYHVKATNLKKIVYETPRKSSEWVRFIKEDGMQYIKLELEKKSISARNDKIIVFILGHIGYHGKDLAIYFKINFIETLTALSETHPDITIFIKPHVFTKIELIIDYISEVEKAIKKPVNYVITKLHPMVLSLCSQFVIFNNDSTIIKDMIDIHVPVVQYLRAFPDSKIEDQFASQYSDYIVRDQMEEIYEVINDINIKDTIDYSCRLMDVIDYNFNCNEILVDVDI